MTSYLRYRDDLETPAPDEAETFAKIIDMMTRGTHTVKEHGDGRAVRISHAKAHGFVLGTLEVDANLPPELAQGLFAKPGSHPALMRISQAPGEVLDDQKVSSPRGMALKVFDVEGPKLPGHEGATTQDFVTETGKVFIAKGLKDFLAAFTPNAMIASRLPEGIKGVVSEASRATNAVLHAAGTDSPKLDFYGHPKFHPMGEAYYSQVPFRYGDYVARFSFTPANPELELLFKKTIDIDDPNALRKATVEYFRDNPAVFDIGVQLATDVESMPIEDGQAVWSEEKSPFRKVGRVVLPPQNAYDPALQRVADLNLSFSPAHSLAAHRPLGAIGRARLAVYPVMADLRRRENGEKALEPRSPDELRTPTGSPAPARA